MKHCIVLVEDDKDLREAIQATLMLAEYECVTANCAEQALSLLAQYSPDLIVSDVNMPGMDGIELLKMVRRDYGHIPMLLMTAYGTISSAIQAMRQGACDYVLKPFEPEQLLEKISNYLPKHEVEQGPIAEDPKSKQVLHMARKVAASDAAVLISGASGTGKEVLAKYIHDNSPRADKTFVAINCAAIPENMLEATLFGYEKGAFTGAVKSHEGKFEQAQYGSLLLDEISEMDINLQAKLLRVLQEKEVERLGANKNIPLDVRIIATTNRDLKIEIDKGTFREDLFYRLNVFPLHWLPLKERSGDIIPLAEYLITGICQRNQRSRPNLSKQARSKLNNHHWQGNAREMENVIQRALILCCSETIEEQDIQFDLNSKSNEANQVDNQTSGHLASNLQNVEHQVIIETLNSVQGNRKQAAQTLGISERTLRYKIAKIKEAGIVV